MTVSNSYSKISNYEAVCCISPALQSNPLRIFIHIKNTYEISNINRVKMFSHRCGGNLKHERLTKIREVIVFLGRIVQYEQNLLTVCHSLGIFFFYGYERAFEEVQNGDPCPTQGQDRSKQIKEPASYQKKFLTIRFRGGTLL